MKKSSALIPLAALLAGCMAGEVVSKPDYNGLFHIDGIVAPDHEAEGSSDGPARTSWTAEEIARRAGQCCGKAKEGALEAAMKRLKVAEDLAWKNPEFRYGYSWGLDRSSKAGIREFDYAEYYKELQERTPDITSHPGETPWEKDGFSNGRERPEKNRYEVRLYIPNPFVNRYLRRQGAAEIAGCEALACAEAFGVYSEVKLLCNELQTLTSEIAFMTSRHALCTNLVELHRRRYETGVAKTPYQLLRARNRLRSVEGKLALTKGRARAVRTAIALMAELPTADFRLEPLEDLPPDPPTDVAALCEIAFARRPDLMAALEELEAAEARVGVEKAAWMPWFRYVEASYSKGHASTGGWGETGDGLLEQDGGFERGEEYGVGMSVIVPIFDWCGNKVSLAKAVRERASDRVDSLYRSISNEVVTAVADYRTLRSLCLGSDEGAYIRDMRRRISEIDASGGELDDEKCLAEQELVELEMIRGERISAAREAYLQLESVVGGPLDEALP